MAEPATSRWGFQSELYATQPGSRFDVVAVIPVEAHARFDRVAAVVEAVLEHELRCILVDDGRADPARAEVLQTLVQDHPGAVKLLRLPTPGTRGAAMAAGLVEAHRRGHTHALQLEADNPRAVTQLPGFVAAARLRPEALVCGDPAHGLAVHRPISLLQFMAWCATLSPDIRDAACPVRLYPLAQAVDVVTGSAIGHGIGFDTEIAVRLHWQGLPVINHPVWSRRRSRAALPARAAPAVARLLVMLAVGMVLRMPMLLWRSLRREQPRLA